MMTVFFFCFVHHFVRGRSFWHSPPWVKLSSCVERRVTSANRTKTDKVKQHNSSVVCLCCSRCSYTLAALPTTAQSPPSPPQSPPPKSSSFLRVLLPVRLRLHPGPVPPPNPPNPPPLRAPSPPPPPATTFISASSTIDGYTKDTFGENETKAFEAAVAALDINPGAVIATRLRPSPRRERKLSERVSFFSSSSSSFPRPFFVQERHETRR